MAKVRIQKALGDAGILSRRKAEELIKAGKITVNGHRAEPGNPVDIVHDVVVVDGKRVEFPRRKENVYIMLNKPRGYVTTTSDELGRRCVTELVEDLNERVYPVGRLDKNTEGLLLMTNDGQFANMMMHPRNHVSKTYRLTVRPDINDDQLVKLSTGVQIDEDLVTMPASVIVLEKAPGRVVLQITISEGKNRQIRRMCEAVGLEVARLKRISMGPLKLGMLQPGQWRELKKAEVLALRNAGTISDEIVNEPGQGRDSHGGRGRYSAGGAGATGQSGAASSGSGKSFGESSYGKPVGSARSKGRSGGTAVTDKPTGKPMNKPFGEKYKPVGGAKGRGGASSGAGKPFGKSANSGKSYGKPADTGKSFGKSLGNKPTGNAGAKSRSGAATAGSGKSYGAGRPAGASKPFGDKKTYSPKKPTTGRR